MKIEISFNHVLYILALVLGLYLGHLQKASGDTSSFCEITFLPASPLAPSHERIGNLNYFCNVPTGYSITAKYTAPENGTLTIHGKKLQLRRGEGKVELSRSEIASSGSEAIYASQGVSLNDLKISPNP